MRLSDVRSWVEVHSVRGDEVLATCPYHSDSKPSFFINLRKKVFYCFGCNASGYLGKKMVTFVRYDAYKTLSERFYGIENEDVVFDLPYGFQRLRKLNRENMRYWEYLTEDRGIKPSTIRCFSIGYCETGDYENRVVVPLEMGFLARTVLNPNLAKIIDGRDERYLYPLGLSISKILFNFDKRWNKVILVEGSFDSIALYDYGYNATSLLGSKLSTYQIKRLLKSKAGELILALDGDDTGYKATQKIRSTCSKYFDNISIVRLPEDSDPSNISKEEWIELYENREKSSKRVYSLPKLESLLYAN